jgi:transposase
MKTVAKINPEEEYENAKKIIELAGDQMLDAGSLGSLEGSVDNLITTARILIEREERRRGQRKPPKDLKPKGRKKGEKRSEANKLPSKRFPNLPIKEKVIRLDNPPSCPCCNKQMKESGLFDISESLEVIPKKYYIVLTKRVKYNCGGCHGALANTPASPSVVPQSNYGDSVIVDATLSKFCDLIPMERYVQIAYRAGIEGIPAQSLIGLTHHLANFLHLLYLKIKKEVLAAIILQADETTHKMLEGDEVYNWYLWGFFSNTACYFETHKTRSGDVIIQFLRESKAEYLVSDGYSGYKRAIKEIKKEYNRDIVEVDCNAHAYRYFKEASEVWKKESTPFLELYGEIYDLEKEIKELEEGLPIEEQLGKRRQMLPKFEELKELCEIHLEGAMPGSGFKKSLTYFLNQYEGLIQCTRNIDIPLDNNLSERELRSPVVGRKTWYGTHSKRGATTMAVHFSIVQSCKLNGINPRSYYPWIIERIHNGEEILTPSEYSKLPPSG